MLEDIPRFVSRGGDDSVSIIFALATAELPPAWYCITRRQQIPRKALFPLVSELRILHSYYQIAVLSISSRDVPDRYQRAAGYLYPDTERMRLLVFADL